MPVGRPARRVAAGAWQAGFTSRTLGVVIANAQALVYFALYFAVFVLAVWAFVDAVSRPAAAFVSAGKRTKGLWVAVTGASSAVAFVALPWPFGIGALAFLARVAAVAASVYLVDVRPAVRPYSGRGRRGGNPPSRGSW